MLTEEQNELLEEIEVVIRKEVHAFQKPDMLSKHYVLSFRNDLKHVILDLVEAYSWFIRPEVKDKSLSFYRKPKKFKPRTHKESVDYIELVEKKCLKLIYKIRQEGVSEKMNTLIAGRTVSFEKTDKKEKVTTKHEGTLLQIETVTYSGSLGSTEIRTYGIIEDDKGELHRKEIKEFKFLY